MAKGKVKGNWGASYSGPIAKQPLSFDGNIGKRTFGTEPQTQRLSKTPGAVIPQTSWTSLTDPAEYAKNNPEWTNPLGINPKGDWAPNAPPDPNAPPSRGSLVDTYGSLKNSGLLPDFKPIAFDPIASPGKLDALNPNSFGTLAGLDASKYGTLSGFGDDYYANLTDQATKRMQDQYFTSDKSLSNQLKNQMNKRGLIGSGIEAGATTDLYKDFGSELSDFQSNLASQKAQQDLDIARQNREFAFGLDTQNQDVQKFNLGNQKDLALQNLDVNKFNLGNQFDLDKFNTQGKYEAAAKDREAQNMLTQLGLSASGDELRSETDFKTKIYDSQQKAKEFEVDKQNNIITQLNTALSNENIDPKERAYYRDLLSSYMGSNDLFDGLSKTRWEAEMGKDTPEKAAAPGQIPTAPQPMPAQRGTFPGQWSNGYQWSGTQWVKAG